MNIPPWVLEGSNGATALALVFVFAFQVMFLAAAWWKIQTPSDFRTAWLSFYRQLKPVIALTVAFGGFLIRFGGVWLQRHAENTGGAGLGQAGAIICHVVGTSLAIIGVLCWLRVSLPRFCGIWTWLAITLAAAVVFILPGLR